MVSPKAVEKTLANLSMSGNATVRAAAKEHLNLIRAHAGKNGGKVPAYALDDIRQNINGMLAKHAPNGAVGSQEGAKYRSEEHTSELQSLMRISYDVSCLKKKNNKNTK